MDLKYFKINDFDSPDLEGSGINMQKSTLELLEKAREIAKIPFYITSGFRSEEHNTKVGGVKKTASAKGSSHMYGYAVDIAVKNGSERFIILNALLKAGFNRAGVANGFIHADNDPDKPKNVLWKY